MSDVDSNLMKDEVVRYRAHLHWNIYVVPALCVVLVIGVFMLIAAYIKSATSEFAVTSRRVIIKVGFISRKTVSSTFPRSSRSWSSRGSPGRIFGYGAIVVVGTGGTRERFPSIAPARLSAGGQRGDRGDA